LLARSHCRAPTAKQLTLAVMMRPLNIAPQTPKLVHRVTLKRSLKHAVLLPQSLYLRQVERERLIKARGRKKIYYLMGLNESHRNLGDQAQGVAIREWFRLYFGDYEVFEYRCHERFNYLPLIQQEIADQDLVVLHSGGNFGDTWPVTEGIRQEIIRSLPGRPIVQLPQTIDFSNTLLGRNMLASAQAAIRANDKMIIMGRDLTSAALAAEYFPGSTVRPFPDMVLSLAEHYGPRYPRPALGSKKRLLMIMRNDKEGVFTGDDIARIRSQFGDRESEVWDTTVADMFPRDRAKATIEKYLDHVATFDHVITDRYHGLIFAVITNRPVVVLPTVNHKITSAASWFSALPTVRFAASMDVVRNELEVAIQAPAQAIHDWNSLHFRPMADLVKSCYFIQR
jgi:exopolysaccharide biosynthesis predicted pyruvyltransferase EpsI